MRNIRGKACLPEWLFGEKSRAFILSPTGQGLLALYEQYSKCQRHLQARKNSSPQKSDAFFSGAEMSVGTNEQWKEP